MLFGDSKEAYSGCIGPLVPANVLMEIKTNISLKTYCANIRVPILYEFSTKLDINKIIYSDVDNILITDLHKLFKEKKIFYIRKVNLNFIDKLLNNASKIMHYKSPITLPRISASGYLISNIAGSTDG